MSWYKNMKLKWCTKLAEAEARGPLVGVRDVVEPAELLEEAGGRAVVVDHEGGGDQHDGHAGEQQPRPRPALLGALPLHLILLQSSSIE